MRRPLSRRVMLRGGALALGAAGLAAAGCGSNSPKSSNANATAAASSSAAAGPPVSLKGSYVGTPYDVPLFLAKDQGIFQSHNLDVSLSMIAGPPSVAALIAGQIQVDQPGGSEVVSAAVNGGDLTIVAVLSPVFNFKFYARPNISSVADLKGKKLGITTAGGSFDTGIRLALPKYGLDPDKDVSLIAAGSIANVVAALIAGSIDGAAIVVGPDSQKVEAAGMKTLFDYATLDILYPEATMAFQHSYLTAHRDVVQRYVDSIIIGTAKYKQDKATSLQELSKIYQSSDQEGLNLAYNYYTQDSVMPRLPFPKPDQFKTLLDVLCKKVDKACNYDISKVLDPSFVQSASDRGLGK